MSMELRLVKGKRTIFRLAIPAGGGEPDRFELRDESVERMAALYSLAANERRLRVMARFARGGEMRFSEIMQIAMNPKLVQDCLGPMMDEGLVEHAGRGSGYRASQKGLPLVFAMTLGFEGLLEALEGELEGEVDE